VKRVRLAPLLLAVAAPWLGSAPRLEAQEPRDTLVRRAFVQTDPVERLRLLFLAADPSVGPTEDSWWAGVQLLAQTLLDQRRDSTAAAWLRWAIRLRPGLEADTVQFSPRLVGAFRAARDFVGHTAVPEDTVATTSWSWPMEPADVALGRVELARLTRGAPQVMVQGVGPLTPGAGVDLAPGSYRLIVTLADGPPVTLTREVLPGVTTRVSLRPPPVRVAMPPPEPSVTPGRRLPWKWMAVGAVGVGALVAVLAGSGGSDGTSTGGIIITLPSQ
jgi:hypothetical protein